MLRDMQGDAQEKWSEDEAKNTNRNYYNSWIPPKFVQVL